MKEQHTQLSTVNALIIQLELNLNNFQNNLKLQIKLNKNNQNLKFLLRYFMPYCTTTLKNGNKIFLNRGYKPLGIPDEGNNIIDYETFENVSFKLKKEDMHFYSDGCTPWDGKNNLKDYLQKLKEYMGQE